MRYVVWAVRFEVRLYVALMRWIARRPDVPQGSEPWGYSRIVTPVMWLWIFASAMELPLVHVLVPWEWLRITLLVIGVWGLVWMVGLLASYKVYPHLVTADGLRVRLGKSADVRVPWSQVAAVRRDDRDLDSTIRTFQIRETDAGPDVQVGVSGRVNVQVRLTEPLVVPVKGRDVPATAVSLLVDDPREFVAAAQRGGAAIAQPGGRP